MHVLSRWTLLNESPSPSQDLARPRLVLETQEPQLNRLSGSEEGRGGGQRQGENRAEAGRNNTQGKRDSTSADGECRQSYR